MRSGNNFKKMICGTKINQVKYRKLNNGKIVKQVDE